MEVIRLIVYKKLKSIEQINDYIFIDTQKAYKIKMCVNNGEWKRNEYEMKQRNLVNTGDISPEIA